MDDDFFQNYIYRGVQLAEPFLNQMGIIPVERPEVVRNENYFEYTIPNYSGTQFREHFRMTRGTFTTLLNQVREYAVVADEHIPFEKKLLFTLWTISKQDCFLSAGDRFGFAKSSAHVIFEEIIHCLGLMVQAYITWPNRQQQNEMANVFEQRSNGIPGVIDAIDGCHITIKQPKGNAHDYYDRDGNHSVILQGVCDYRRVFIDAFIGMPGRMHDARVYRLSPLYNQLEHRIPDNCHLIGDSEYPLSHYLMKPYQHNGHLTREQRVDNQKLSSIRSTIEGSFGLLKGRFRRLKYLDVESPEMANRIILAACVLHNFILLEGNAEDQQDIDIQINEENEVDHINNNNGPMRLEVKNKRRRIVDLCNF